MRSSISGSECTDEIRRVTFESFGLNDTTVTSLSNKNILVPVFLDWKFTLVNCGGSSDLFFFNVPMTVSLCSSNSFFVRGIPLKIIKRFSTLKVDVSTVDV